MLFKVSKNYERIEKACFPITRKAPKKSKKSGKMSAGKIVIAEFGKRVEKYDLINSLAQSDACITFGHIARGGIDFTKSESQRIPAEKVGWVTVNFAGKEEVHGVSMSGHILVRVEVYSESTIA